MTSKYEVLNAGRVVLSFAGNFDNAASPLMLDGDSTPFQVADARHRPLEAAKLLNRWAKPQGGEAWTPGKETGLTLRTYR